MPEDNRDMAELLDQWQKENNARCLEGTSGVRSLEKLLKSIGYGDGQFFSDTIRNFLSDNSGAIEALLNFIGEGKVQEWEDALKEEMPVNEENNEE